ITRLDTTTRPKSPTSSAGGSGLSRDDRCWGCSKRRAAGRKPPDCFARLCPITSSDRARFAKRERAIGGGIRGLTPRARLCDVVLKSGDFSYAVATSPGGGPAGGGGR